MLYNVSWVKGNKSNFFNALGIIDSENNELLQLISTHQKPRRRKNETIFQRIELKFGMMTP